MRRLAYCLLLVLSQVALCLAQDRSAATSQPFATVPLPVTIKATDPRLYYVGRFDTTDGTGPRAQWALSQVRVHFRGTDLQARMRTDENSYFQVEIDGKSTSVLRPGKGEYLLDVATHMPEGEHEVAIVKRTEVHTGIVQFLGFHLNAGGELLPSPRMVRRIEVVGDTVVSGYGNEAKGPEGDYLPEHQNAYMSFGAIAGRDLNAEVTCISYGFYPELIQRYDQALPVQPGIQWQFTPQPDAIVVMAWIFGFNSGEPARAEMFIKDLRSFVLDLRRHNPNALIYLATSPVVTNAYPEGKESFKRMCESLDKLEAELTVGGDTGIRYLEFATQDIRRDGFGGGYNPTVKTHAKMAKKLVEALGVDLNWQPGPSTKPAP